MTEREKPEHFGGPVGAAVLTVLLPFIPYYLTAAIYRHGGQLWIPRSGHDVLEIVAPPTPRALAMYGAWFVLHALLYLVGPGKVVNGATLRDGTSLPYKLNGLFAHVVGLGAIVALLATHAIRAQDVVAEIAPFITISTILIALLCVWFYFWGRARGEKERSTGLPVYDFFMGTVLNPRIGLFDWKFFIESRMGMATWGALCLIVPWAQYEQTGHVSLAMLVVAGAVLVPAGAANAATLTGSSAKPNKTKPADHKASCAGSATKRSKTSGYASKPVKAPALAIA